MRRVLHGGLGLAVLAAVGRMGLQWSMLGFPDGYRGPADEVGAVLYPVLAGTGCLLAAGHGLWVLRPTSMGRVQIGWAVASAALLVVSLLAEGLLGWWFPSVGG
ncbi:MAG: hypothetical protein KTR31_17920 [Myxococcales bacterium]|nr:hypothetical protein [Myxococcales bacterium]